MNQVNKWTKRKTGGSEKFENLEMQDATKSRR